MISSSGDAAATRRPHFPGDLGRRVAQRRHELGLSLAEVAKRAGMAPGYLERIEDEPGVHLATDALTRLARALETSVIVLLGADVERPLGASRAAVRPRIEALEEDECSRLVSSGGVGRLVFDAETGPEALPVNFALLDGEVVFRTVEGGLFAHAAGKGRVAFEVDHVDEAMSEGWSVLIAGTLEVLNDPEMLARAKATGVEPWAGGHRDTYCRLRSDRWSGRRIYAHS